MTTEDYIVLVGTVSSMIGLVLGLLFGRQRLSVWLIAMVAAVGIAFVASSGVIVRYEMVHGTKKLSAGLAWATTYAPSNLLLSLTAAVFFLLATAIRSGIYRIAGRHD